MGRKENIDSADDAVFCSVEKSMSMSHVLPYGKYRREIVFIRVSAEKGVYEDEDGRNALQRIIC